MIDNVLLVFPVNQLYYYVNREGNRWDLYLTLTGMRLLFFPAAWAVSRSGLFYRIKQFHLVNRRKEAQTFTMIAFFWNLWPHISIGILYLEFWRFYSWAKLYTVYLHKYLDDYSLIYAYE